MHIPRIRVDLILCIYSLLNTEIVLGNEPQLESIQSLRNAITTTFVTPSGNIYCALIGDKKTELRCEIRSRLKPLPPQPYPGYCKFDWGSGFSLSQHGRPKVLCISDTIASNNSYTLAYGSTWRHSGFQCISKRTSLICKNYYGNGFSLNRNNWSVFSKRE